MTRVGLHHVRSGLGELADADYQARVWTGHGAANEMSSFVECVSRLFDDSGLDAALENNERVFGAAIDRDLAALGDLVTKVDGDLSPDDLIRQPGMRLIRERASAILKEIDNQEEPSA